MKAANSIAWQGLASKVQESFKLKQASVDKLVNNSLPHETEIE